MKIGILTSSRADFGIYFPLIRELETDSSIELEIIAFGTHLSRFHGYTIDEVQSQFKGTIHQLESMMLSDSTSAIASAYGLTALKFADFWNQHNDYNLVLCLGDRYEMAAAVTAGVPFGIKFGHLHGGETTLGAIDNIYRHQITIASTLHFTSTEQYAQKVADLIGTQHGIYNVAALSLDGIDDFEYYSEDEFFSKFPLQKRPFILCTFHPETIAPEKNFENAEEWGAAIQQLADEKQVVVTMPNADTQGSIVRKQLEMIANNNQNIVLIEHFGKKGYFSAMRYCTMLLGNTSSGIIEAASFGKYVVNVGSRQKGRACSENTFHARNDTNDIVARAKKVLGLGGFAGSNVYHQDQVAVHIQNILNKLSIK